MLSLFGTALHTGVLGALLTLSRRVLYPAQSLVAPLWGMSALQDQQLAGLIMWVPGGLLYLGLMSVVFLRWMDDAAVSPQSIALQPYFEPPPSAVQPLGG